MKTEIQQILEFCKTNTTQNPLKTFFRLSLKLRNDPDYKLKFIELSNELIKLDLSLYTDVMLVCFIRNTSTHRHLMPYWFTLLHKIDKEFTKRKDDKYSKELLNGLFELK